MALYSWEKLCMETVRSSKDAHVRLLSNTLLLHGAPYHLCSSSWAGHAVGPLTGYACRLGQCNILFFVISSLLLLTQRVAFRPLDKEDCRRRWIFLSTHTFIKKIKGLKWGVGWSSPQMSCWAEFWLSFFFLFSWLDTELEGTGVGEEKYRCVEKHHVLAGEVQWIIYWQMGYRLHVDCSVSDGSFM